MRRIRSRQRGLAYRTLLTVFAITLCGGARSAAAQSSRATKATIKRIAKIYAQDSIQTGGSVGIEVGIVYGSEPPQFVSAGDATARAGGGSKFTSNTIFQIGSVSKVFTTNLLGQSVANGSLNLSEPLSSFETDIGPLEPLPPRLRWRSWAISLAASPAMQRLVERRRRLDACRRRGQPSIPIPDRISPNTFRPPCRGIFSTIRRHR